MAEGTIVGALTRIQSKLKAPKDQKSKSYSYRNIEDVNEAVKPLAAEEGCAVVYDDSLECIEGRLYMRSTCTLVGDTGSMQATGLALVTANPKFMSVEQQTGAASSYARKYAACGLFAIDSSADDPDAKPVEAKSPRTALIDYCSAHYPELGYETAKELMQDVSRTDGFNANDERCVNALIADMDRKLAQHTELAEEEIEF